MHFKIMTYLGTDNKIFFLTENVNVWLKIWNTLPTDERLIRDQALLGSLCPFPSTHSTVRNMRPDFTTSLNTSGVMPMKPVLIFAITSNMSASRSANTMFFTNSHKKQNASWSANLEAQQQVCDDHSSCWKFRSGNQELHQPVWWWFTTRENDVHFSCNTCSTRHCWGMAPNTLYPQIKEKEHSPFNFQPCILRYQLVHAALLFQSRTLQMTGPTLHITVHSPSITSHKSQAAYTRWVSDDKTINFKGHTRNT
jgi:hypothetical protein